MKLYVYLATVSFLTGCAFGAPAQADHHFSQDGGAKDAAPAHDSGKPPPSDASTVEDSGDHPDSSTTTCSLSLGTGIPACDTCLGNNCCYEDTACGNDPECMDFITCVNNCFPSDGGAPDQTCFDDCSSLYPNGSNELMNLDSCMQTSCATDCQ